MSNSDIPRIKFRQQLITDYQNILELNKNKLLKGTDDKAVDKKVGHNNCKPDRYCSNMNTHVYMYIPKKITLGNLL